MEFESLGFFCPDGADVFVGCKPPEGLEPSSEVVGVDEVGEMLSEVLVGFVVEALDGRFLDGSIHAFDLAVRPGMFRFGQVVIDVELGASELEGMGAEGLPSVECEPDLRGGRTAVATRGEIHSVVGEHVWILRLDFVVDRAPTVSAILLPEHVERKLRQFASTADTVFGSFDFVIDEQDVWWFLEVNQGGQVLWIDDVLPTAGTYHAMLTMLAEGQRREPSKGQGEWPKYLEVKAGIVIPEYREGITEKTPFVTLEGANR